LKRLVRTAVFAATFAFVLPAAADKVVVLPFSSAKNVPRPELDEARKWTREAATKKGHTVATDDEMVSVMAAIKDGIADISQEYVEAGKVAGAKWTVTGHVERIDYPPSRMPDGTEEDGYTTYRVELEACQVDSGRVESLSREVLPEDAARDIEPMLALLLRPEGLANAQIPWERNNVRPKPRPKVVPKPPPPPPPVEPSAPPDPPKPREVYGQGHPFAIGASIGVTNALVRPDQALGPSWAMPIGGVVGYALPEGVPGLELRAQLTSQAVGPKALEFSAGARYAFAPARGLRFFVGPELLVGGLSSLGADKTTRFLTHGAAFVAFGLTENIQLEAAADLAAAFGGTGTLLLGGGTGRFVVRF
jgi:hypothetical protein